MKQEVLNRIDSVVDGYVNVYRTDWTEIDRPHVEKLSDSNSFLVMMRPSGVDVAFFDGDEFTLENAFHSQAAVQNHELFLYYDGDELNSVTRTDAQKLCDKAASRFENLDLPMDGFRKAVERLSLNANRFENRDNAVGECGSWKISLINRQYTTGLGMEVCFEDKPVVRAFKDVSPHGDCYMEIGRYHNSVSDKTFNEIFDSLRFEFPSLKRDFNENKRLHVASNNFSK